MYIAQLQLHSITTVISIAIWTYFSIITRFNVFKGWLVYAEWDCVHVIWRNKVTTVNLDYWYLQVLLYVQVRIRHSQDHPVKATASRIESIAIMLNTIDCDVCSLLFSSSVPWFWYYTMIQRRCWMHQKCHLKTVHNQPMRWCPISRYPRDSVPEDSIFATTIQRSPELSDVVTDDVPIIYDTVKIQR